MLARDFYILMCIFFGAVHVAAEPGAGPDRLGNCPDSPNCVSSMSDDKKHFIKPIDYSGSFKEARQKLVETLSRTQRVRLVTAEENYIHAEFRSLIFRFVDDVEFYLPAYKSVIHVKSASRSGYYDFGANRRRVERLRAAFYSQ